MLTVWHIKKNKIDYTLYRLSRIYKGDRKIEMDTVLIGTRIKEARRLRGITADALSEKIGVAAQTLRHVESGANKTKLQSLINIADALNVSVDYLLGCVPSPQETLSA